MKIYWNGQSKNIIGTRVKELRKAQGLKELTWSDDVYNSRALPKAHTISRQYDSTGFVARREDNATTVATNGITVD